MDDGKSNYVVISSQSDCSFYGCGKDGPSSTLGGTLLTSWVTLISNYIQRYNEAGA